MIKAVFFDWYNTLARYDPPSEELQIAACAEAGVHVTMEKIRRGIFAADQYFYEENSRLPLDKRSSSEQAEVYRQYENVILREAGTRASNEEATTILMKVRELAQSSTFVLFTDVIPVLSGLKNMGLILGMISNITQDMLSVCQQLGLIPYLNFIVTSSEAGADKPRPAIFLNALDRAQIKPIEAMHVGDQYSSDIIGAHGVGMKALLLDRHDMFSNVTDCPRIRTLAEVADYI